MSSPNPIEDPQNLNDREPPDFLQENDEEERRLSTEVQSRLMEATGEIKGMRINIPQLRLYPYGKEKKGFYLREWDGAAEKITEYGDSAYITLLVKREYCAMWKGDVKYYTNRFDDRRFDMLTLYAKKINSLEPKVALETGTFKELRDKFSTKAPDGSVSSDLRLHQIWYVLTLEGKIAEMDITGDSLRSLFLYHDKVKQKQISIASLVTEAGYEFKEKGSVKYYCMTFNEKETVKDFSVIFEKIEEIKRGIALMKQNWEDSQREFEKTEEVKKDL